MGTRDQLEAYTYETRRQVTSLIMGADQAIADPRRRLNRVAVGSAVLAVLVMAGFGIAGLLGGGSGPALPEAGAVLLKDTGDTYVVVDGRVHPALNLSSALLVGGGQLVKNVRSKALRAKPRGLPVGIPGAPDSLPQRDDLTNEPWTVCVIPSESTAVAPKVTLLVGMPAVAGGTLTDEVGTVVQDPVEQRWLITHGRRHKLAGNSQNALGLQRAAAPRLPAEVLNTIPEGQDFAEPSLPDGRGGTPAFSLPSAVAVGDLVEATQSGKTRHYAVHKDGLTEISEPAMLLLAAGGSRTVAVPYSVASNSPISKHPAPGSRSWPAQVPKITDLERDQPLCISTSPGTPAGDAMWPVTISTPDQMPDAIAVGSTTGDVPGVLSSVVVKPGSGALVKGTTTAGQDGVFTLVTDSGQRFPIPSEDSVRRLLYEPGAAKGLPWPFVSLLPSGPVLDPVEAAKEYIGSTG